MSPTSTLLVKIYTLDRVSKQLVVIGYCATAVFLERASGKQPSSDAFTGDLVLNSGAHQLRIHRHGPDTGKDLSADSLADIAFVSAVVSDLSGYIISSTASPSLSRTTCVLLPL